MVERLHIKTTGGECSIIHSTEEYLPDTAGKIYTKDSDSYGGSLFYATREELIQIRDKIDEIIKDFV
jgi:hypothetical protein